MGCEGSNQVNSLQAYLPYSLSLSWRLVVVVWFLYNKARGGRSWCYCRSSLMSGHCINFSPFFLTVSQDRNLYQLPVWNLGRGFLARCLIIRTLFYLFQTGSHCVTYYSRVGLTFQYQSNITDQEAPPIIILSIPPIIPCQHLSKLAFSLNFKISIHDTNK